MHLLKRYIAILLSLYSISLSAQTTQQIDSLISQTRILYRASEHFEDAVNHSFEILDLSEKIDYERGIVISCVLIAEILSKSGDWGKSVSYTRRANQYSKYLSKDPAEKFYLLMLEAENYDGLELKTLSNERFWRAEKEISAIKDEGERLKALFYFYISYLQSDDSNTYYHHLLQAEKLINSPEYIEKEPNQSFYYQDKALLYINLGDYYWSKGRIDSSKILFETALDLLDKSGAQSTYQAFAYECLGNMYKEQKNYPLSLDYLLKSLEIIRAFNMNEELLNNYAAIADVYGLMGMQDKKAEYKQLYQTLSDSLSKIKKEERDSSVFQLVKAKEADLYMTKIRHRITVALIVFVMAVISGWLYVLFRKYKKNQERQLEESRKKLNEKLMEAEFLFQKVNESAKELVEKEQEAQILQQKVNESFSELIELAKENHPNFYTRFREIYPVLHQKLLDISPDLRLSELTLCAYIYLGFTTKEIAEFTFTSVRTVQTRKSNLRKKLEITSSEDIYIRMKEMAPVEV